MSIDADGFYGLYRGVVHNNRDPLNQGRLQLRVPQILADQVTGWAWNLSLPGVEFATPAINQGVWVMFEGGNPSFPIWVGTFGTSKLTGKSAYIPPLPPGAVPTGVVVQKIRDKVSTLNLTSTVVALANLIEDLEDEIETLAGNLSALEDRVEALETAPSP